MNHSFNVEIAKKYGIKEAIILEHLYFWVKKNEANEENFYAGRYWTYNTIKAFATLFPYFTARQINYALEKLVDYGLIIKGNYNKSAYDRTLWYALTDNALSFFENSIDKKCEIDFTKLSNGNNANVKPIPDINTDINTDININTNIKNTANNTQYISNTHSSPNSHLGESEQSEIQDLQPAWSSAEADKYSDELFNYFWEKQVKKVQKKDAQKAWKKIFNHSLKKSKDDMYQMAKKIMAGYNQVLPLFKLRIENKDAQGIPYPATWLNGRRWEDDPKAIKKDYESYQARLEYLNKKKSGTETTQQKSKYKDIWDTWE